MQRDGVTSRWSREKDARAIFHAVFAEATADDMAPFAAAYDFSPCGVVADLGGAGGGLLAAILLANPQSRGILVDREQALAGAAARFEAAGLAGRCQLVGGDLLQTVPAGANAYILKSVLHGYDDDAARRILENCRAVMMPKSRLLLIENVLPAKIDAGDPQVEQMLMGDLSMLVVTGGRERGADEWGALLWSAGFDLLRIVAVPGSTSSIIEAAPRAEAELRASAAK